MRFAIDRKLLCHQLGPAYLTLAFASSAFAQTVAHAQRPAAPSPGLYQPAQATTLSALETMVRAHSPIVEQAALDVDLAHAEARQSHLLGNPVLDAAWGTIPIGETNPPGLARPLANVPNYNVGLSYTFEMGKRGPRQERAAALERGAQASYEAVVRAQALELAQTLGELATVTLRIEGLRGVADGAKKAVDLAESRQDASFGTPLDVDRVRIESSRAQEQLRSAESDLGNALARCSALLGEACAPFSDASTARAWLSRWIDEAPAPASLEQRADLRALDAYRGVAEHEAELARAQAIPDPTVRVGYTHDRFLVSGNQGNSLSLSVSIPLPVFDHGQAAASAADARAARLAGERQRLIEGSRAQIPALVARLRAQQARERALTADILPRARKVLADVDAAAAGRLLTVSDVIQARRTVSDLLIEEADSFSDAFNAALELMAQLPAAGASTSPSSQENTR